MCYTGTNCLCEVRTINIFVEMDADRTEQLGIPELAVIKGKGDTYHFYTVKQMSMMYNCPFCGSPSIKNQGIQHREYADICVINDDAAVICLDYQFNKYKCLEPGCGHVFTKKIAFASPYSRTTHRLEDAIVRMIVGEGYSYAEVAAKLEGRFSRQVIGRIYLRRKAELEADPSEASAWYRVLGSNIMSPLSRMLEGILG